MKITLISLNKRESLDPRILAFDSLNLLSKLERSK